MSPAPTRERLDRLAARVARYADLIGPAGEEDAVIGALVDDLASLGVTSEVDSFGNVAAPLGPRRDDLPTVMISAHLDEIGFVVRKIASDGFVRVHRVGGVHDRVVAGQRIVLLGEDGPVRGVVGVKAKHASSAEELARSVGVDDAYLDLHATSADEVRAMGVEIGTLGTFDATLQRFGTRLTGKALDDRAGVAVLVELAERLRPAELPANAVLLGTAQEEFAVRGGVSAARRLDPDVAFCVDVAIAHDTPDLTELGETALGGGPVLTRFTRATLNGLIPHPTLRRFAARIAASHEVPLQHAALQGGLTDASTMQHEGRGIPSLDVSFPTRYTHTPVETIDLVDLAELVRWIEAMVRSLNELPSLDRA
jgi:putative aminopeptidase FrvX